MTPDERELGEEFVRQCLSMDEKCVLYWKMRPREHFVDQRAHTNFLRKYAGKKAGRNNKGYVEVWVTRNGVRFQLFAHRIVWMLHTGKWPEHCIDHINRVRNDNRIENLRDVPAEVNLKNNGKQGGTGLTGVFTNRGRFYAKTQTRGKGRYLGRFETAEAAHAAYLQAKDSEVA